MKDKFTGIARAYGYSPRLKKLEAMNSQNFAISEYAEMRGVSLPFTNLFENESELEIPFAERPKAKTLLNELRTSGFNHLIVTWIDLLGRSPLEFLETVKVFNRERVTIHLLDFEGIVFDEYSELSKTAVALIAWAAKTETKYKNAIANHDQAIQSKLDQKREQGILTGSVPYGWDIEPTGETSAKGVIQHRLVDNPEEQAVIRRMIAWRQQRWGYHSIANELNREGIKTKKGKKWNCGGVRQILLSRTVRDWLKNSSRLTTEC